MNTFWKFFVFRGKLAGFPTWIKTWQKRLLWLAVAILALFWLVKLSYSIPAFHEFEIYTLEHSIRSPVPEYISNQDLFIRIQNFLQEWTWEEITSTLPDLPRKPLFITKRVFCVAEIDHFRPCTVTPSFCRFFTRRATDRYSGSKFVFIPPQKRMNT